MTVAVWQNVVAYDEESFQRNACHCLMYRCLPRPHPCPFGTCAPNANAALTRLTRYPFRHIPHHTSFCPVQYACNISPANLNANPPAPVLLVGSLWQNVALVMERWRVQVSSTAPSSTAPFQPLTHTCLCRPSSIILYYSGGAVMIRSWVGNRRSVVALAMHDVIDVG